MHMRDDDVFDLVGIKPDHPQSVSDRTQQRALSFRRAGRVETGVKHKTPVLPNNRPDEIASSGIGPSCGSPPMKLCDAVLW